MNELPDSFAEQLLAGLPDAVIYAGSDGLIRHWNDGAQRLFGFTQAEAIGQSLDIIIPAGLRDRHWDGFQQAVTSGRTRYGAGDILAVPAVRKDGSRLSVEFTIVPFMERDGGMIGIAAVIRDATARFEELRALRKEIASLKAS
jgi:PAS domain S-box-containing protein